MKVRDGMTRLVLTIGPAHTLREAARLMSARRVGAAVVIDDQHAGVGILTERDILDSIGSGQDPDGELAAQHRTTDVVFASPDWTLQQAAETMAIVTEAAAARRGKPIEQEKLDALKAQIVGVFDGQMDVFSTSARVLDDGVIDPRDTRAVLAEVLAICREAESRTPQRMQFSVARP